MSTSIRPPGSGPGPVGLDSVPGSEGAQVTEAARGQGVQGAAQTGSAGAAQGTGAAQQGQSASAAGGPTAQWLRRLEAGEITRDQAIDGLVAQALERHGGVPLTPALRTELEGVLRAALLEDPVLGKLLGGA